MSSPENPEPVEQPVSDYELWRRGYGVIQHSETTCDQARHMVSELVAAGLQPDTKSVYRKLASLDRLTSAGLWLVAHMTYTKRVDTSGTPCRPTTSKRTPRATRAGRLTWFLPTPLTWR